MKKYRFLLFITLCSFVIKASAQNDSLAFFCFKQGYGEGDNAKDNCASVAIIKAAIIKFGLGQVFNSAIQNNSLLVTLRNGKALTLSPLEIAEATAKSGFQETPLGEANRQFADRVILYADTLYAIIAKYIQLNGYAGCYQAQIDRSHSADYETALAFITKPGVCTDNIFQYLGLTLTAATQTIPSYTSDMDFSRMVGVVLYSNGHAIAVYHQTGDGFGQPVPIKDKMKLGFSFRPKYYFVLQ